jgi:hypothetical protein
MTTTSNSIATKMRTVRIFPSSPGDVALERDAVGRVVARLNGIYGEYVQLQCDRWEDHFYEAGLSFQQQIEAMAEYDLVVGIVWMRIGSELPPKHFRRVDDTPYQSGTVYEIETAIEAERQKQQPSVFVFRCDRRPELPDNEAKTFEEAAKQRVALEAWWNGLFRDDEQHFLRGFQTFISTDQFETRLDACLDAWLKEHRYVPDGPIWDITVRGSPYPGLRPYDCDRREVFFGRGLPIAQARDRFLASIPRPRAAPVLFVIGQSGSGKSSLVRAGIVPELIRPGVVTTVDLWRVAIVEPAPDSLELVAARLYASDALPDGTSALPELAGSAHSTPVQWAELARVSPASATDTVGWALRRIAETEQERLHVDHGLEARLLLVVDQLETLFGAPDQKALSTGHRKKVPEMLKAGS